MRPSRPTAAVVNQTHQWYAPSPGHPSDGGVEQARQGSKGCASDGQRPIASKFDGGHIGFLNSCCRITPLVNRVVSNELEDHVGQLRPAVLLKEVAGAYMEY